MATDDAETGNNYQRHQRRLVGSDMAECRNAGHRDQEGGDDAKRADAVEEAADHQASDRAAALQERRRNHRMSERHAAFGDNGRQPTRQKVQRDHVGGIGEPQKRSHRGPAVREQVGHRQALLVLIFDRKRGVIGNGEVGADTAQQTEHEISAAALHHQKAHRFRQDEE